MMYHEEKGCMNKMNFGKRVREVRKKQDLTSEKLAEICEISPVYVRQIECSARTPSLLVFMFRQTIFCRKVLRCKSDLVRGIEK